MAEVGNGYNIDPAGEARAALQSAVAEYGRDALSNPVVMDGVCRNRLPHLTGECILIGSAARSGVPALLRDRAGPMGTDQAIRSVAAIVSAAHGLNQPACEWIVREYAQLLGYVPAGPVTAGAPPPRRGFNRSLLGLAVAAALVGAYLAVAAMTHLTPFGRGPVPRNSPPPVSQRSSPAAAADAAPDATPDPAADPDPGTPYSTLMSLIPSDIQNESSCRNYGARWGAAAAIECSGVPDLSGGSLFYYLYTDTGTLNQGYDDLLNGARFPYTCTDSAGDFAQFVTSCQSQYHNDSAGIAGMVSEYLDTDNEPTVSSTDDQQLVMTVMIGANANNVLAFWDNPTWIATGS